MLYIEKEIPKEEVKMAYNNQYNNNGEYQNRNGGQRESKASVLEPVIIRSFYKDDHKTIDPELFDSKAKEVAKSFIGNDDRGYPIGVSSSQLRRLFDEVKRFEQILLLSTDQWDKQLPYIKMIKSKVAYSVARAAAKKDSDKAVYKNLEKFISSSIDQIKKEQDYHVFVSLFEAAYGFYYELAPKNCK
jgi:CRISPR-associated protein Csm2